ncbi:MAG: SPOR domain-containing protein, partial [Myxococcota bacterium]
APEPAPALPTAAIAQAEPAPKAEPKPAAKKAQPKPQPKKAPAKSTLASGSKAKPSVVAGRKFTLQMKAFAKREQADAFAAQLNTKGHGARVESQEVKGRLWHRVRVGSFDSWAEGIAAKEAFESKEKIIAYVVRK